MPELTDRNQVGKREDLSDVIAVVDARAMPFTTMCPKGSEPANSLFDWQVDKFADPSFAGVTETKDVTEFENAAKDRRKLSGRIQIFERKPKVGRVAENVNN